MTLLETGDILQITTWCQQGNQCSQNVGHFLCLEVTGGLTDTALADLLATAAKPLYRAWMPTTASFEGVMVRRVNNEPTATVLSTIASGAGLAEGDPLPAQVCGVVTLKTDKPGPGHRGRRFVGFGSEDNTTTAFDLNAAGVTALADIGTFWFGTTTYGVGDTVQLTSILYKPAQEIPFDIFTSRLIRTYLTTQKRRAKLSKVNVSPFGA